jgi:hypothetical protein
MDAESGSAGRIFGINSRPPLSSCTSNDVGDSWFTYSAFAMGLAEALSWDCFLRCFYPPHHLRNAPTSICFSAGAPYYRTNRPPG